MAGASVARPVGIELAAAVELLDREIAGDRLLGAQIAVLVGGELVLDEGRGARDASGGRLLAAHRVPWFCASKVLAGVAAVRLLDRVSLPLSTPVATVLPELAGGGRGAVELRHLMDHTAGFPSIRGRDGSSWRDYDFVLRHDYDHMLRACLATPVDPGWVPGRDGGYHLTSATYVLSAVVERLAGRPYEDVVDELVLRPSGAAGVTFRRGRGRAWAAPDVVMPHRRLWDGRAHEAVLLRDGGLGDCPGLGALGPILALARVLDGLRAAARDGDPVARVVTERSWVGADRTFGTVMEYGLGLQVNMRRLGYGAALPAVTFGHAGWDCTLGIAIPELDATIGLFLNGGRLTGLAPRRSAVAAPVVDLVVEAIRRG